MALLVGLMLGTLRKVAVPQRAGGRILRMRVAVRAQRRGLAELGADCDGIGAGLGVGTAGQKAMKSSRLAINYCRMNGLYALGDQIADQRGLG